MACNQTLSGLTQDCAAGKGGIKVVYLINHALVTSATLTAGKISAIVTSDSAKFLAYHFRPETAGLESTRTIDHPNGVNYVSSVLTMAFNKMETTKRVEIEAMALNEMAAIVLDENGVYWYLGYDNPVVASGNTGATGTAHGDRNGYTIELTAISDAMPFEVEATAVASVI